MILNIIKDSYTNLVETCKMNMAGALSSIEIKPSYPEFATSPSSLTSFSFRMNNKLLEINLLPRLTLVHFATRRNSCMKIDTLVRN